MLHNKDYTDIDRQVSQKSAYSTRSSRPIPMVMEQPPLSLCGLRHAMYNAEGGARICSWIHIIGSVISCCCTGILGYHGASIGWSLTAGLTFFLCGVTGIIACIYRLTLTILFSMITCLCSAVFSMVMILWAAFCLVNFIDDYNNANGALMPTGLKIVMSVQLILGFCGVAELVTDIIHSVKAIRIICCFRDGHEKMQRQGSHMVQSPSLRKIEKRPKSLVIENPGAGNERTSVFV